jgi:O-succinylbenzoate synthase
MSFRIDSIVLHHVRMRLKAPFETSFGVELDRDCLILEVRSEGLTGWGECVAGSFPGYSYETTDTAWHILKDFLIPAVFEAPIVAPADLTTRYGAYKGHPLARAGLELALWDLQGLASRRSLADMLGVDRHSVPVGVSVGIQPTAAVLLDTVRAYVDQGYPRVKLKIKPGRDLEEVTLVQGAFPWLPLQVDANSAYSLDQAAVFEEMDELGLLLIEQPLGEDDLLDHSLLQSRLRTPLCLDESIQSLRHARQALEIDACRVINIKQARVGGLTEAIAIHDLCLIHGVPVWCGGMLETGIGRAANLALAGLPGFQLPGDISASDRYYAQDIAEPAFHLNQDGTIDIPAGPGLGIGVLKDELAAVTLRTEVLRP